MSYYDGMAIDALTMKMQYAVEVDDLVRNKLGRKIGNNSQDSRKLERT